MMQWARLLSNKRLGQEEQPHRKDDRTEFQRDYDRIIFSAPFRRLQNKTQVFPLPGSVFVHNRLTHSLEVSCVGRSLGNDVAHRLLSLHPELSHTHLSEIGSIVSAACLAHDMGNPPFGHSGENAIKTFFSEGKGLFLKDYVCPDTGRGLTPRQWDDLTHFDGNANAFRLLAHQFRGKRAGGFVMTYSTLASVVKYPYTSDLAGSRHKFGFFQDEAPVFARIADELGLTPQPCPAGSLRYARHPLVFLVEAADDICYQIMDIEDAHKLKILTTEETHELLLAFFEGQARRHITDRLHSVEDINEQTALLRSCAIGCLENECVRVFVEHEEEIMNGTFEGSLIRHISPVPCQAYRRCAEVARSRVYQYRESVDIEIVGFRILLSLLELMVEAAMHPGKTFSQLLLNRVSRQYDICSPNLSARLMAVLDYISGMTDVYALDLYQRTFGMKIPTL